MIFKRKYKPSTRQLSLSLKLANRELERVNTINSNLQTQVEAKDEENRKLIAMYESILMKYNISTEEVDRWKKKFNI